MTQEMMMQSLTDLLEGNEKLRCPVYGTLKLEGRHCFGFFGLTDRYLLIALLDYSLGFVGWTRRIPLKLKAVKVKRTLIPFQRKVIIEFPKGKDCELRISKKVMGFPNQKENFAEFTERLKKKV